MTKTYDAPKPGHKHDLDLNEVAAFHMTMFREGPDPEHSAKTLKAHLVSGTGSLLFGVDGDQVTVSLKTRRNSALDPNVWMEGAKLNVPAAEHIIRALITLVAQAKKNEIDKPTMFGNQYSGLPLTKEEE